MIRVGCRSPASCARARARLAEGYRAMCLVVVVWRRFPAHDLWAMLIARIDEVLPLVCPRCGGNMRILAFVTEGAQIRRILEHIGVHVLAPPIAPARGRPLWDACDAQGADGARPEFSGGNAQWLYRLAAHFHEARFMWAW